MWLLTLTAHVRDHFSPGRCTQVGEGSIKRADSGEGRLATPRAQHHVIVSLTNLFVCPDFGRHMYYVVCTAADERLMQITASTFFEIGMNVFRLNMSLRFYTCSRNCCVSKHKTHICTSLYCPLLVLISF
jgi:hypothetical protein